MRALLGVLFALLLVPAAGAESIVFVAAYVTPPDRIVMLPVAGGALRTIVANGSLPWAVSEDGLHRVDVADRELQYDGRTIAHVSWSIDDAQLSPDGRLVAFTALSAANCGPQSRNCGNWELWLVGVDGTGLRQLTGNGRYPRFSPDGTRLSYLADYDGFGPSATATVERLSGGRISYGTAGDSPIAWSADSQRIAFSGMDGWALRVASASARGTKVVAKRGNRPVFSPDGKSLAYEWKRQLRVTTIGGATRIVVADHFGEPFVWPNDSIYYVATPSSWPTTSQLAAVRGDGSGRRIVTDFEPTTSIDRIWIRGAQIVLGVVHFQEALSSINAVDLGTGAVSQLTHNLGWNREPTVRSDGTLAYVRGSGTRLDRQCLFVTKCVVLGHAGMYISSPSWSPDMRRLAVVRYSESKSELWISNGDGTHGSRLTWDYLRTINSPSWSPDGKRLVFSRAGPGEFYEHLWLADVAKRTLSKPWRNALGYWPSWSPDGRWIVFQRDHEDILQTREIALLDPTTGVSKTLVPLGPDGIGGPAWSPDGTRIAYIAADHSLHVINLDGSGDRKILSDVGGRVAWAR